MGSFMSTYVLSAGSYLGISIIYCFSYTVKIVHKDLCNLMFIRYNFILFLKYEFFCPFIKFLGNEGSDCFPEFLLVHICIL